MKYKKELVKSIAKNIKESEDKIEEDEVSEYEVLKEDNADAFAV